jgi:pyrrolysine biosynthesis protein PylD
MLADDERFVALHIRSQKNVDNAVCTGNAFVTGLSLMAGSLREREVLVIGLGPVGRSAAQTLIRMGAHVSVYDVQAEPVKALVKTIGQDTDSKIQIVKTLEPALQRYRLIIDASPARNIIHAHHITPDTYISTPGIPCGLDAEAQAILSDRYLYDPLQLGVATMLLSAVKCHIELQQ